MTIQQTGTATHCNTLYRTAADRYRALIDLATFSSKLSLLLYAIRYFSTVGLLFELLCEITGVLSFEKSFGSISQQNAGASEDS